MKLLAVAAAWMLMLGACGSSGSSVKVSGDSRTVSDVTIALRVEPARIVSGQASRFTLRVLNVSGRPKTLEFSSSKRYDFWVTAAGAEVWRWSQDRSFAQSFQNVVLQGQGTEVYSESWSAPAVGEYIVHAELAAVGYEGALEAPLIVERDR